MPLQNQINANENTPLSAVQGGSGISSPTVHGVLVAEGSSAFVPLVLADGEMLIGSSGADPVAASLTAGAGIAVTPAAGALTVSLVGSVGVLPFTDVAAATQAMAVNNGYTANDGATLVTFTLPAVAAYGSLVAVVGKAIGLYTITQNSGQTIHFGNVNSTTGVGGSLSSTNQFDAVYLLCTVANTDWTVIQAQGTLTVV